MVPSSATKRDQINIPTEFMRKEWKVKLNGDKVGGIRLRMGGGWHAFSVSNKLKNEDTCVFELPTQNYGKLLHTSVSKFYVLKKLITTFVNNVTEQICFICLPLCI